MMATLLDGPTFLRKYLLKNLVMEGHTAMDGVCNDEEEAEAFIRKAAVGVWHASCTCRMGPADDPMAVTDSAGRVHGIGGLRCGCVHLSRGALCKYQYPNNHDGRKSPTRMLAESVSSSDVQI